MQKKSNSETMLTFLFEIAEELQQMKNNTRLFRHFMRKYISTCDSFNKMQCRDIFVTYMYFTNL